MGKRENNETAKSGPTGLPAGPLFRYSLSANTYL